MTGKHRKHKGEDVADDPAVAQSRKSRDEDGSYVGRVTGEESFDTEKTGAEARAEER